MYKTKLISFSPLEFEKLISLPAHVLLVVIGADWCGGYHLSSMQMTELQEEFKEQLTIHHVDFDSSSELMFEYGISKPPALLFFNDGQLRDKLLETTPKDIIRHKIFQLL